MEEVTALKWAIGIVLTILGLVISYTVYSRNRSKDDGAAGKETGTILTELGYIKGGIDDLKMEQREQRKVNTEVYSRLSSVEASAKQAHKRLDGVEARQNRIDKQEED